MPENSQQHIHTHTDSGADIAVHYKRDLADYQEE